VAAHPVIGHTPEGGGIENQGEFNWREYFRDVMGRNRSTGRKNLKGPSTDGNTFPTPAKYRMPAMANRPVDS
jgi:hypothetical protein